MEKPSGQELQQQQQSLKCPRCDSINTKFCYYNNYSLSQPRHFCKSCKRYWTRGGTLRNVPVGGGCRKNKRMKRPAPSASDHTPSSSSSPPSAANSNLPSQPHVDSHVNPLFYGLPGNSNSDMNPPFSSFNSGYDHLQPRLNGLGLGFCSGYASSDSLFSNYNSIFGNSIFGSSPSTSIASLLSPSTNLQQQKFINGGVKDNVQGTSTFQGLEPLEKLKVDEERPNQIMEHGSLFDYYSPYYWNDQTNNVGPSVTSLIE